MAEALDAFGIIAASVLFVIGVLVLAVGAHAWSNAIAATHRARAHGYQADSEGSVLTEATDSLRKRRAGLDQPDDFENPSDEELLAAAREHAYYPNTEGNEGIEPEEAFPSGTFYRRDAG